MPTHISNLPCETHHKSAASPSYHTHLHACRTKPGLLQTVSLLQTAHSWANTGVLLDARVRLKVAFETINYRDEVSERKVIDN